MIIHKHDPKTYTIACFSPAGRRVEERLAGNFQGAVERSNEWDDETGGTSVILVCLRNSALQRPVLPEDQQ